MLSLRKHIILPILLLSFSAIAQDRIYLKSSSIACEINQVNSNLVSYSDPGNTNKKTSIPLSSIIIAFNEHGSFILPSQLNFEDEKSKSQIEYFLDSTAKNPVTDIIFTVDNRRLEGEIDKEDKKFIYFSSDKIEKKSIVAIIYKTGKHQLYESPTRVSQVLSAFIPEAPAKPTAPKNTGDKSNGPSPQNTGTKSDTQTEGYEFEALAGKVTREEFVEKSKQKTLKLNDYLKLICTRSADYEERNKAIDQAVNLFVSEDAIVETSSLNRTEVRRHKIRNYLSHIKMVQYDRIDIEWTAVQFVSEVKKGPDGNYYGVVSFEQVFRGYRDGKLIYQDITRKHATVVLKTMEKNFQGNISTVWDVLLSDIGVVATKSA